MTYAEFFKRRFLTLVLPYLVLSGFLLLLPMDDRSEEHRLPGLGLMVGHFLIATGMAKLMAGERKVALGKILEVGLIVGAAAFVVALVLVKR